ncbi:hypothetical protein C7212DRAFT_157684 [Tuber magnatum]|uniref:Rhodopsin domain-containing protein n=1 Tax=Tuber magnatum TaxID=42249 RepID=A0A317SZ90_9PEZI|nr:hypothetical protein C7212DRAFT_157684 [Tuber magnatum]
MVSALVVLIVRVAVIHLVLVNGTNNVRGLNASELSDEERHRREFGSKLVLVGRSCYAIFIWCMKFGIASFYERIVAQLQKYRVWLKYIWVLLVSPPPNQACNFSEIQLYTTGACNIFTDLVLIIYPLPLILSSRLALRSKLQIGGLFSLGFLVILVSVFRLPYVVENKAIQRWRSLFASTEILVACFVANAPALYRTIGVRAQGGSVTKYSGRSDRGAYLFTANKRKFAVRVIAPTYEEEQEESEGTVRGKPGMYPGSR